MTTDNTPWSYEPIEQPHLFVQWKGTDVCFDFYCKCGKQGHFDGGFAYFVRCELCGRIYESPFNLCLREVENYRGEPVEPVMDRD